MARPASSPRRLALACAGLLLSAAVAASAATPHPTPATARVSPFTGHWVADLKGDGKQFSFDLDLLARGDTLTGTVEGSFTDQLFPVTRGRVRGNTITFQALGLWTGALSGGDLKLVRELDGGKKQNMTAHRKPAS